MKSNDEHTPIKIIYSKFKSILIQTMDIFKVSVFSLLYVGNAFSVLWSSMGQTVMGGWDDFAVFSTSVLDSCGCVQVFHGCIVFTHKYYRKMNWMILKHVKYEDNWEGEDDFKKWRSEILHCCLLTWDRGAVAVGGQRQKRAGSLYQGLSYTLFCLLYQYTFLFLIECIVSRTILYFSLPRLCCLQTNETMITSLGGHNLSNKSVYSHSKII